MNSMFPIISMSDLQRSAKKALANFRDFAVLQRHGKDVAFVLRPELGRMLVEGGLLEKLREACKEYQETMSEEKSPKKIATLTELDHLIGQVLRELSKK